MGTYLTYHKNWNEPVVLYIYYNLIVNEEFTASEASY